jgi:hypothetical protein
MFRDFKTFKENRGTVWISEGITPILGSTKNPEPHVSLPVGDFNPETRSYYVIDQGTAVGVEVENNYLVPSTNQDYTVTYDSVDAAAGVTQADGTPVTPGDTRVFVKRKPVGVVIWDILQNPKTLPNDFQTHLTQTAPTIRTTGYIMLPIVHKVINDPYNPAAGMESYLRYMYGFENGDLVTVDHYPNDILAADCPTARPGGIRRMIHESDDLALGAAYDGNMQVGADPSTPGTPDNAFIAFDNIAYKLGKVMAVETMEEFNAGGLETVRGDGVNVQSDSTHGFPMHIWNSFKNHFEDDAYTKKIVYVNIDIR